MKRHLIALTLGLTASFFAANLRAEDTSPDDPNWFSFGPSFGLNIDARFKHIGNVSPATQPGPAVGGGVDRNYDDGYVRVDSSGNLGGQTWNWGYQHASQVQSGTLMMHSSSSAVNGSLNQNADPHVGFDLAYGRRLGNVVGGKWGLQAAFDFTAISIRNNQSLTGTGTLISDAFSPGGITPPLAPYSGGFNGPDPLLGDTPTRTTGPETVLIAGQRKLDANIYALRAGPYYEFSFSKRWSGRLGGGLAVAVADTSYSFNETITFGSGLAVDKTSSSSGTEVRAGGYLEGKLLYSMTRRMSVFAAGQYEYLGTFSRAAGGEQAQLDMGSSLNVLFGVQWKF